MKKGRTAKYPTAGESFASGVEVSEDGLRFDLEERLVEYAVLIVKVTESLPLTRAGNHVGCQLLRCGTSPAANYGEAQSAESHADFLHKMKVCLKELRESSVWLRIITRTGLTKQPTTVESATSENDQLIRIFVSSIRTSQRKNS